MGVLHAEALLDGEIFIQDLLQADGIHSRHDFVSYHNKCLQHPRRSATDPKEEHGNIHANSTVVSFSFDRATEKAVNRRFLLASSSTRQRNSWCTIFLVVYPLGTTWGEPNAPSFWTRRRSWHEPKPVLRHQYCRQNSSPRFKLRRELLSTGEA